MQRNLTCLEGGININFRGIWEALLDIIYPLNISCIVCGEKKEDILDYGICSACEKALPFIRGPACIKCGKAMGGENNICSDCLNTNHLFYKSISVFEFSTEVKRIIYRYKYQGEKYLAQAMIYWMTQRINLYNWKVDFVVPVPLHSIRERKRGFNQSEILAKGISENLGVSLVNNSLQRIRNTVHQTNLNKRERQKNLKGAFKILEDEGRKNIFEDKSVLLVDDVYTTGSTTDQCSRALLAGGAKRIYVITLAAGLNF